MIMLHLSSGHDIGDCLGGVPSSHRLKANLPYIVTDSLGALQIIDSHVLPEPNGYIDIKVLQLGGMNIVAGNIYRPGDNSDYNFLAMPELPIVGGTFHATINDATGEYIQMRRIAQGAPTGQMTIRFAEVKNPIWCEPYSCIYLHYNGAPAEIVHFESSGGGMSELTKAASVAPIDNHGAAPTGITWDNPPITSGTLEAGWYPIWIKGDAPYVRLLLDSGEGVEFDGNFRNAKLSEWKRWRVYGAYDGRTVGGDLLAESDVRPVVLPLEPPESGERTYRVRLVEQTQYGIESQNWLLDHEFTIDAEGRDVTRPAPPADMEIEVLQGGYIKVRVLIEQDAGAHPVALVTLDVDAGAYIEISKGGWFEYVTLEPVEWGAVLTITAHAIDAKMRKSDPISRTITAEFTTGAVVDNINALAAADASASVVNHAGVILTGEDIAWIGERNETALWIYGEKILWTTHDRMLRLHPDWIIVNIESLPEGTSHEQLHKIHEDLFAVGGDRACLFFDVDKKEMQVYVIPINEDLIPAWQTPVTKEHGGTNAVEYEETPLYDVSYFQAFDGQYFTAIAMRHVVFMGMLFQEIQTLPIITGDM